MVDTSFPSRVYTSLLNRLTILPVGVADILFEKKMVSPGTLALNMTYV
jgi:hypothetical protein